MNAIILWFTQKPSFVFICQDLTFHQKYTLKFRTFHLLITTLKALEMDLLTFSQNPFDPWPKSSGNTSLSL
jgi:hypothetical protein